ncbi:MAG: hypothetical protein J7K85_04125 [Anaerolineaceae bacterium]|nr:hypothetical protein [Anaerolineaceae bacterium]
MQSNQNIALKIRKLLVVNSVMSLKQLRSELNDRPRSSLYRDLKTLNLISSFTHTGQYHVLNETARFDQNGLWFFQEVGFSQYGTLKKTLVQITSDSLIGMTHKEMKTLFRIEVQKPLTDLVNTNAITRQLLPSRLYVYLSADQNKAEDQLQRRLAISNRTLDITLPPESIRIEILVEVIHAPDRTLDATVLGPLLRKRGVIIKDEEVSYVLAYYDIKKNGF